MKITIKIKKGAYDITAETDVYTVSKKLSDPLGAAEMIISLMRIEQSEAE